MVEWLWSLERLQSLQITCEQLGCVTLSFSGSSSRKKQLLLWATASSDAAMSRERIFAGREVTTVRCLSQLSTSMRHTRHAEVVFPCPEMVPRLEQGHFDQPEPTSSKQCNLNHIGPRLTMKHLASPSRQPRSRHSCGHIQLVGSGWFLVVVKQNWARYPWIFGGWWWLLALIFNHWLTVISPNGCLANKG